MAERLERILREICFRIKVKGREVLKKYPITPAQFDLMQKIYFTGPKTMGELSTNLGIAKSTTTGLVNRLEKDGFLERIKSNDDKRVITVSLTEKGKKVIDEVINERVQFIRNVLESMPEHFEDELINLLEKFNDSMIKK
ncbi:MAG: MarR family transcriptional regulator, organic hydroperoxide resistance regulator [Thermosipho sp. (in: thermotogales)]|nr:MarR family transcriptional regulator, organic hydroperoxide resistance regulator [Thermosipho sp. (in: thermotogales)]MDN5324651.1 MarR family transcriptional regulator, organic hydroperoxide resistance regulator [Thermosipho sp. (in: thermotogales)]